MTHVTAGLVEKINSVANDCSNHASHGDVYYIAASPPFRSRACLAALNLVRYVQVLLQSVSIFCFGSMKVSSNRPNLFSYATSELSQDAVICWLLAWAGESSDCSESALNQVGVVFLSALFKKAGRSLPPVIDSIKVERQVGGIDILCTINDQIAVLIEDKAGTQEHSGQLDRYLKKLSGRNWPSSEIIPVYLQTGDQSSYGKVRQSSYNVFLRHDFLQVLGSSAGEKARAMSDILDDYYNYLRGIEVAVQGYLDQPVQVWERRAWQGFYQRIQRELGSGHWKYVPNPSGGFLCFHWHHCGDSLCKQYLLLEEEKLCFKISVVDSAQRSALRKKWHKRVAVASIDNGIDVERPRFGNGKNMTVGVMKNYRISNEKGLIDISKTVSVLLAAQAVLDDALASVDSD